MILRVNHNYFYNLLVASTAKSIFLDSFRLFISMLYTVIFKTQLSRPLFSNNRYFRALKPTPLVHVSHHIYHIDKSFVLSVNQIGDFVSLRERG